MVLSALSALLLTPWVGAQGGLTPVPGPGGGLAEIRLGQEVVAVRLGVNLVKPKWEGRWFGQLDDGGEVREATSEREVVIEGGTLRIAQALEATAEGLRLSYRLTPSVELPCEGVFITVGLPVGAVAGTGRWYAFDGARLREETFPAELPKPYHLYGGATDWLAWVLPSGQGIQFDLARSGFGVASLQDDRQFGTDQFELQLPVPETRTLAAGKEVAFELLIRPFTAEQAAKEVEDLKAREEAQKVRFESRQALRLPTPLPPFLQKGGTTEAGTARRYEGLEWTLDLEGTWDNPFDEREVEVSATFTAPSGRAVRVLGFWDVPYTREVVNDQERLTKAGDPMWRVRFTPSEVGEYAWKVTARDRSGTVESETARFTVEAGEKRGFVRRSPDTPYYLQYDNGQPYFAVGEDVCWGGGRQTLDYDLWFPALGAAGGNFARIWLVRWNMALEWNPADTFTRGKFYGAGLYSMDNAARLDYVLDLAEKSGVYCMLALGYHGELLDRESYFGEQCWVTSPYNQANGGPCAKPEDFWTNPEARRLYKQKLRYYVARYAHSPHVQSWEFWNEVVAPADWIAEMAAYLKSIDPYRHLVTTTYGYPEVWNLPDIDFTQTHMYGTGEQRHDGAPEIARLCREHTEQFGKPHFVGEFGIDWQKSDGDHDPQGHGINLHNGLWSSMASRGMGGAAIWYWDGYVHPKNLYHEFTALARFAGDILWNKLAFRIAEVSMPTVEVAPGTPWRDLTVQPPMGWGTATGTEFTVQPDGRIAGEGAYSSFLYSPAKPNERRPLSFRVNCPQGGQFVLHADTVSARAVVQVSLDGQPAWEKEFKAGPEGEGEYKTTKWFEQYNLWQSTFDQDYAIDLPPGEHTISLDNRDGDWITIATYTFKGCLDPRFAPELAVRGLCTDDLALLWLQNANHNWYNATHELAIPPIPPATFTLRGLRDGQYTLEWYDTSTGLKAREERVRCEGGELTIKTEPIAGDVACKVRR
ncbi:MAG: DUF5060 domain-containing protein [Armatimonadetes bacterium]|nr:DUF5060 domain-containing protein [Armatimonadota bacterium]